jgi:DNA-binding transcriptional regulator YiaG
MSKGYRHNVTNVTKKQFMSESIQALRNKQGMSPKSGGRGSLHKEEPRDKVVRIRSSLFKEMSESELARRFNVDFDDICSEVWEFWKKEHSSSGSGKKRLG